MESKGFVRPRRPFRLKRRRPVGVARLHSRRGGQTTTKLDEAEYQYPGGPNLAIEVGQAGVSNSMGGVPSQERTIEAH